MKSYAEFLAEQGASPDEIKILDTPAARKGYEAMTAQVEAAAAAQRKADEKYAANVEWAKQVEEQNQNYLKERDTAKIEAAAANARYETMQKLGLVEIAERMEPGSTAPPATPSPTAFDPNKYLDRDSLLGLIEREGEAIATSADITAEHMQLFPGKPLNFRELRKEATSRRVPVEQVWMERYNVAAERQRRSDAAAAAERQRIADEAIAKYKADHPETNPLMAQPTVSRTPFTDRLPSASAADSKQPWQRSDAEREQARLQKVLPKLEGLVH